MTRNTICCNATYTNKSVEDIIITRFRNMNISELFKTDDYVIFVWLCEMHNFWRSKKNKSNPPCGLSDSYAA